MWNLGLDVDLDFGLDLDILRVSPWNVCSGNEPTARRHPLTNAGPDDPNPKPQTPRRTERPPRGISLDRP